MYYVERVYENTILFIFILSESAFLLIHQELIFNNLVLCTIYKKKKKNLYKICSVTLIIQFFIKFMYIHLKEINYNYF